MRALLQRVSRAAVSVDGGPPRAIGRGLAVLVGVRRGDAEADADWLVDKIAGLRVFSNAEGKFDLALGEVGGALLVVSQFTLYGSVRKGRRPDFTEAARPEQAVPLYERFIAGCRAQGFAVETGEFGAAMAVELVNEGPVTLMLDSADRPA